MTASDISALFHRAATLLSLGGAFLPGGSLLQAVAKVLESNAQDQQLMSVLANLGVEIPILLERIFAQIKGQAPAELEAKIGQTQP